MIRVVIADDQRVVRDGLTMLVGLIDDFEVVGAASDGAEAVDLARDTRPDVVLMDLRMPEMDGTEATHQIRSSLPETQVLVLTTYADDESLFPALQAGASGYLTKDASAEEIESAIRAVASGRTHLDPAIQQRLIAAVVDATRTSTSCPTTSPHAKSRSSNSSPRASPTPRSPPRSSSAVQQSKPTSTTSSRRLVHATALKLSATPTNAESPNPQLSSHDYERLLSHLLGLTGARTARHERADVRQKPLRIRRARTRALATPARSGNGSRP